MRMSYDHALEEINGCGRYQVLMFFLLSFTGFKGGMDLAELTISTTKPSPQCTVPWNVSESKEVCLLNRTNSILRCSAWTFLNDDMQNTIVTEFSLLCDNKHEVAIIQSVQSAGLVVGMVLLSLSDSLGRKRMICVLTALDILSSVCLVTIPGLLPQYIFRFFRSIGFTSTIHSTTWITEAVTENYRMLLGANFWNFWCLGFVAAAGMGKATGKWRLIIAASCAVAPIYLAANVLIVESPRWLLAKGRIEEAEKNLQSMARWNGKKLKNDCFKDKLKLEDVSDVTESYKKLLRSTIMLRKLFIPCFAFFVIALTYYLITLDSSYALENIFLNVAAMGLVEIPSNPLAGFASDSRLGRRYSTFAFLLFSGIIVFTVPYLPMGDWVAIRAVVAILGKMMCTACYSSASIWFGELMPVTARSFGIMCFQVNASVGALVAPFILSLESFQPGVIVGSLCLGAAVCVLFLPETRGLPLAQTVEEAILLTRGDEKHFCRLVELQRQKENPIKEPLETVAATF